MEDRRGVLKKGLHFVLELPLSERLYYQVRQTSIFLEVSSRNPLGVESRRIGEAAQVKFEIYEIFVCHPGTSYQYQVIFKNNCAKQTFLSPPISGHFTHEQQVVCR